ncbi:MAG TPA: heme-binding domain-containing protein [Candidatus Acidoferrum sp.]|nr:heme-binding domain-containing protein [Candidatus Acidoferrum sp.]
MRKSSLWGSLGALVVLAGVIQIVPYGHDHANPAVRQEPAWDSPSSRGLAVRACYDCHSNQTVWPWYAHVAPVSWLLQRDVDTGPHRLNFSEWDRPQRGTRPQSIDRRIQRGSMPPWYYIPMHPQAKLSDAEKQALMRGLDATVAQNPPATAKP